MQLKPYENFAVVRQLGDPLDSGTYYVQAKVRNALTDELLATINLTDTGSQRFRKSYKVPADPTGEGFYIDIETIVYTDSGYSSVSDVYFKENNTYLVQERQVPPFGAGGGADIDYKRVGTIFRGTLKEMLPKPKRQRKVNLTPLEEKLVAEIGLVKKAVDDLDIPNHSEELKKLSEQLGQAQEGIIAHIDTKPEFEPTDLSPVTEAIAEDGQKTRTMLDGFAEPITKAATTLQGIGDAVVQAVNAMVAKMNKIPFLTVARAKEGEESPIEEIKPPEPAKPTRNRKIPGQTRGFATVALLALIGAIALLGGLAYSFTRNAPENGQNGPLSATVRVIPQFTSDGTNITQRVADKPVKITGLESEDCIGTDSNGVLQSGTCGAGSSGLSTTSPWTTGQLAYVVDDSTVTSVATGTLSVGTGLTVTGSRSVIGGSATIAADSGYLIPLSASTTNWNNFYDTPSTRITAGTDLSWSGNTLNFDNSSGYLTSVAYTDLTGNPSDVITAGTGLSWSTDTLNAEVQSSDLHDAVTLAGSYDYLTLSTQQITLNQIDLTTDVTGTLPVGNGGTGATSLNNLITLGTHTTGNYLATLSGTANQISVAGSGSEGATPTLSIPSLFDIGQASTTAFSALEAYFGATATSTFDTAGNLTLGGTITVGGDSINEFAGTGLTVSGNALTADLGTSISAAEIADGDHGFFSYSSGVASLDTGGLTSANLAGALTNETGSGAAVFGTSPTISSPTLSSFFGTACTGNQFLQDISDTGAFTCATASGGGGGDPAWATTSPYTNQLVLYPQDQDNTDVVFGRSSGATSTAPFWWDVSATTTYIGQGGGINDSFAVFGPDDDNQWILGYDVTDKSFSIASSTALGTTNALQIDKTGLTTSFGGAVLPLSDDVGALGSGTLKWSDLFLASGGVVNWNNGAITLTHGGADTLNLGGADFNIDSDFDLTIGGDIIIDGGGGTASLNNIDALGATTESTIEAALDTLNNLTNAIISAALEIPNGTGPTVNATGEIAVDTTDDQFLYYSGGEVNVLSATSSMRWIAEDPSTSDEIWLTHMDDAITIEKIVCIVDVADTGESVTVEIEERNSTGDSPVTIETMTCDNDGAEDTTISNNVVDAGDWIGYDVTGVSGTVSQVSLVIYYEENRQ